MRQPNAEDVRRTVETALSSPNFDGANAEIAFFGGSFTAIDWRYMLELLQTAHEYVKSGKVKGIRISTRPDAIDEDILYVLKRYGVTSIELGAQSMRDIVLLLNRRGHSATRVVKASNLIKEFGCFSLGLQMMTGLYGDDDEGAVYTAHRIAELKPDTVRIYPTVVLEGTVLAEKMKCGDYVPQDYMEAVPLCAKLLEFFEENDIKVIKLGLHASDGVEGSRVGGAYHPAFRELCEGEIYLNKMKAYLEEHYPNGGKVTVYVDNREISKAIGQNKCNIDKLEKFGWSVRIKGAELTEQERNARTCRFELE